MQTGNTFPYPFRPQFSTNSSIKMIYSKENTMEFFVTHRFSFCYTSVLFFCYSLPYPSVIWTNLCLSASLWTASSFADILQISPSQVGIWAKVAGSFYTHKRAESALIYHSVSRQIVGCDAHIAPLAARPVKLSNGSGVVKPIEWQNVPYRSGRLVVRLLS